jgi:hypothetical protein
MSSQSKAINLGSRSRTIHQAACQAGSCWLLHDKYGSLAHPWLLIASCTNFFYLNMDYWYKTILQIQTSGMGISCNHEPLVAGPPGQEYLTNMEPTLSNDRLKNFLFGKFSCENRENTLAMMASIFFSRKKLAKQQLLS